MGKKLGKQSILFQQPVTVDMTSTTVGPMEGEGPLSKDFDEIKQDNYMGQESWEKAESLMMTETVQRLLSKAEIGESNVDFIFSGDLLNQLIATHFAMRNFQIPFLGLYGACSTMVEAMLLASSMIEAGFATHCVAAASSHHDTAERQYRFPTEMGVQRMMTSQWTVTGCGAALLSAAGQGPKVTCGTVGKIVDMGIKDPNDMGAAMAPAAADTLWQHFLDTGRSPDYYDFIVTGDLGAAGKQLTLTLLKDKNIDLSANYDDCGMLIFDATQDTHCGGSGCGCLATVFGGHLFKKILGGNLRKVLLVATGALHSTTSYQQKESIPCIAHAIAVELGG